MSSWLFDAQLDAVYNETLERNTMSKNLNRLCAGMNMMKHTDARGRRDSGALELCIADILFEEKNFGAHLIVTISSSHPLIDFWPETGRWIVRGHRWTGSGVDSLIEFVNIHRQKEIEHE